MPTGQQHVSFVGQIDRDALVMGSYEPDDARTGVPSGTTLTSVSGNQVITAANTVLQDLDITGRVEVRAANVTIRRCRIRGDNSIGSSYGLVHCSSGSVANLLIEDSTIACDSSTVSQWATGVLGHDYTIRRCRVYNVEDGIGIFNVASPGSPSNVIMEANYVGPLLWFAVDAEQIDGSHDDPIQMQGGVGTIIRWNKLWGFMSTELGEGAQGGRNGPTQTQSISCIMMNSTIGDPFDVEIYENWVYGGEVGFNFTDNNLSVPGETTAIVHRNRFKQNTQYYSFDPDIGNGGIWYVNNATWDFDFGGPNKNIWMDSGLEVGYWSKDPDPPPP